MQTPFTEALPVIHELEAAGYEAYFVGGSVRDTVMSRPAGDIDIATSAHPHDVKRIFKRTVDIGIEHGTILVLYKGESYEVTTFRTESGYKDFRRPEEVTFVSSLVEDLKRRDFTINAMAMDKEGNIIDPFGGRDDIAKKEIKTVGFPEERFGEDALRMMRAARFASQLGFSVEQDTYNALSGLAHLLKHIAVERKRAEFEKLIAGRNKKAGIRLLADTGMVEYLPGLDDKGPNLEKFLSCNLEGLGIKEMWALLLYCLKLEEKEPEAFLRKWKLPVKQIKDILVILHFMEVRLAEGWTIHSLFKAGREKIDSVEKIVSAAGGEANEASLQKWLASYDRLPIKTGEELDVSGGELVSWMKRPGGPWVKEMLDSAERAVLEGKVENKKESIKEWLKKCNLK